MTNNQLRQIEKIAKTRSEDSKHSRHGLDHILRVKKNALQIARVLGLEKEIDLNLLQAACFLHDATALKYKAPPILRYFFEGSLAKRRVREILKPLRLDLPEKQIIIKAVSQHTKSFPFRRLNKQGSLYTKILQDADTLDFFNEERVKKFKNRNRFTKSISWLANLLVAYGRKNLRTFLNFPQITRHFC